MPITFPNHVLDQVHGEAPGETRQIMPIRTLHNPDSLRLMCKAGVDQVRYAT